MKKRRFLFLLLLMIPSIAHLAAPGWGEATDYHVAKTGGGSTCSSGSPCLTIAAGIAKLTAGDRLYIHAGTYDEHINATLIPNGTSDTNRTRIYSFPGETVLIMPSAVSDVGIWDFGNTRDWIEISGDQDCGPKSNGAACRLIFDATNVVSPNDANTSVAAYLGASSHLRFKNFELRNTGVAGGSVGNPENGFAGGGTGVELLNCNVHDNGKKANAIWTAGAYGWYISGGSGHVVDNCYVHHNGGFGLHAYHNYDSSAITGMVIKNSEIYANGQANVTVSIANVLLSSCTGCVIFNSIVRDHNRLGGGIQIGSGCVNCVAYSNTVYNNTRFGILIDAGASGTIVKNNISKDNDSGGTGWRNLEDNGSGSTLATNLCHGRGGTTACNFTGDPLFVDVANNNFRLLPGSPAINAPGTALGAPYNVDIVNTARPQPPGGAYDLGAYEAGGITPSCPGVSPALVASYAFEDSSNDSTGNNHTATLGSGWTYTGGKYGRGVVSTGASGITVADHDALDMCGGFTYEGWISLPDVAGDYAFIVKNPNSKSFLFASLSGYCGAGRPVGGYSQTTSAVACYGTSLSTGTTFNHLAVTYDSSLTSANVKLYLNGGLVTSADGTTLLDATTGTLQFCTSGFGETCPSGTIIDEIRIYNYPRDAAQIVNDKDTAIQVETPTELKISGGTRRIGPGVTLRYGLKK